MMNEKLARVHWEMGQALLPKHLVALEESILADTMIRFRLQGLPCYGVGGLKIKNSLFSEGVLSVENLSFVSMTGGLFQVPGNAQIAPFNLELTGLTTVPVYLHVLAATEEMVEEGLPEEEKEQLVKRDQYRLELSAEQTQGAAVETFKLLEAVKSPEGFWSFSKEFVPPLLQMGASPFLKEELEGLSESLELFHYNLTMDSASYMSGDSLFSVKQCLKSVLAAQRLVAGVLSGIHLHPWYLYEAVQSLYTDVCFYRNANPDQVTAPYNHTQPKILGQVMQRLMDQMQLVRSKPVYVSFNRQDNLFKVELPEELRQASDVYFLVQKHQITDRISVENLKIAGEARLPFVHKMALHGIPLKRIERPPFQHTFGAEVEFYQILESEEWDHALNEKTLAFFSRPDLIEADYYVYWRMGG